MSGQEVFPYTPLYDLHRYELPRYLRKLLLLIERILILLAIPLAQGFKVETKADSAVTCVSLLRHVSVDTVAHAHVLVLMPR